MGSGSSKTGKDSPSPEIKNEDEFRPVKNWEGKNMSLSYGSKAFYQ